MSVDDEGIGLDVTKSSELMLDYILKLMSTMWGQLTLYMQVALIYVVCFSTIEISMIRKFIIHIFSYH